MNFCVIYSFHDVMVDKGVALMEHVSQDFGVTVTNVFAMMDIEALSVTSRL